MKKLFLLDGMALVYRAHFALVARPIFSSTGVNTSALYGFTQTLLEILKNQEPTHLAVAFDTAAPTQRHVEFAEYKAHREKMPEDISKALPHVRRMLEAFHIEVLTCDGCEADDIIGTLVGRAEKEEFTSYMVTPDKDFGQLVTERTFVYKPSRMGDGVEVLGVREILAKWGIQTTDQVADVLGLWGDASDNIPGVPGIGEKTAGKLIAQYGSVENLLEHAAELKGRLKETLESHREQALLSKRLATIDCNVPMSVELEQLRIREPDHEKVRELLVEFEFNSIGRRLYGESFRAGRGFGNRALMPDSAAEEGQGQFPEEQLSLLAEPAVGSAEQPAAPASAPLKTLKDVPHAYRRIDGLEEQAQVVRELAGAPRISFAVITNSADAKQGRLLGVAFSTAPGEGVFLAAPEQPEAAREWISGCGAIFENEQSIQVGHDLRQSLAVLRWNGLKLGGRIFDTMLAHSLVEPEMRHTLEYLSEAFLGYSPLPLNKATLQDCAGQLNLGAIDSREVCEYAVEKCDLALRLQEVLEPELKKKGQERVFYEIEAPLLPVLVDMELDGIRVDAAALADFARLLTAQMSEHEATVYRLAGREFNLNSPKQLGEILFDELKIADKPKKTKTGQYSTNEQTLQALAGEHEIVRRLMEYRVCNKLKTTYADTLPLAISPVTGRIHTTYHQAETATGRLSSENPNLQNIPIRTEQGREIRKAFVPRNDEFLLLSADYSQIELRIIAALSGESAMIEAFQSGTDIHTATAARVYGVFVEMVTPEMRRKAKMVNFGIAYGISPFGLAQRLGIPRKEAAEIIDQYFGQFPAIRRYMSDTIESARERGYVETVTGRRRYLRDIRSSNATIRGGAERNAINAPIQGTAADMIKIAMVNIHQALRERGWRTRMLLQVHDELVFDLYRPEEAEVRTLVEEKMRTAISLAVPIEIEIGVGRTWLEAH